MNARIRVAVIAGALTPPEADWIRSLDRSRFAVSVLCTDRPSSAREASPGPTDELWVPGDLMPGHDFPEFVLGFLHTRDIAIVVVLDSRIGVDLLVDIAALPAPPTRVVVTDLPASVVARYAEERYAGLVDSFSSASGAPLAGVEASRRATAPAAAASPSIEPLRFSRLPPPERSVAVVIACYRHGSYLPGALASVRAQTLPAHEVVVVDDASEDPQTRAVMDDLDSDPSVRVIRLERNVGLGPARNRGIAETASSYVLPLDADDELLAGAIEQLVTQLENAPEDVGFIYPNQQYVGTRADHVTVPDYNLALLRRWNYCAASSLLDRRIFEAGLRYSEDRAAYEDWDLVLSLAERGVRGLPATSPTFLYRKRGFSLIDARRLGPESPEAAARRRHPWLYDPRSGVKSRWAPALSIVLLGSAWPAGILAQQSCTDFEVLCDQEAGVELDAARTVRSEADTAVWLARALAAAVGRWVAVVTVGAAESMSSPQFSEALLRAFWHGTANALALAATGGDHWPLASIASPLPSDLEVAGVAWERIPETGAPEAELGLTGSLVQDLLLSLQSVRAVEWREVAGTVER